MWKHSLVLDGQSSRTMGADCDDCDCTSFNRPKSHFPPQCEMPLHVCLTPVSEHRHSPSCPSPFMLQATQVDLSLLVCAVEDSWTSSFLYKSPSEPDSGDSDLITAGNKRYQHHLGSGFIFSFHRYSLAPFATQPNRRSSKKHWNWWPEEVICFHRRVRTRLNEDQWGFMKNLPKACQ